ncbi:hypothetical protein V5T82_06880 [Magnetovibrio sp. PR-2]|uniref:hypothetical protein n=1 Tax=Magnetovibrio sp. PR-2 TaxID=3120356 RepID=UPI002FCE5A80
MKKNHVELTHDETKVMTSLTRVVHDMISKEIVLDNIWDNKGKKEYLDLLETEDVLPQATDSLTTNKNFKNLKPTKPKTPKSPTSSPKPPKQTTLIPHDIDYGVYPQAHTQRAMDVWGELQHHLRFEEHDNAIAVLFRVLLEFAIDNYIDRKQLTNIHPNDKLANRFKKIADHMRGENLVDFKYWEGLKKFENTEPILSANTMNKYVHSKDFFPSDHHLKSMWKILSSFIVICLKA